MYAARGVAVLVSIGRGDTQPSMAWHIASVQIGKELLYGGIMTETPSNIDHGVNSQMIIDAWFARCGKVKKMCPAWNVGGPSNARAAWLVPSPIPLRKHAQDSPRKPAMA